MEGQKLYIGVLKLLMWALLLSLAFGVSQTKAESREILSKNLQKCIILHVYSTELNLIS